MLSLYHSHFLEAVSDLIQLIDYAATNLLHTVAEIDHSQVIRSVLALKKEPRVALGRDIADVTE